VGQVFLAVTARVQREVFLVLGRLEAAVVVPVRLERELPEVRRLVIGRAWERPLDGIRSFT